MTCCIQYYITSEEKRINRKQVKAERDKSYELALYVCPGCSRECMQNTCLGVHKIANSQNDYEFLQGNFTRSSSQCVVGFNDVMIIRSLLFRSTSLQHYDRYSRTMVIHNIMPEM